MKKILLSLLVVCLSFVWFSYWASYVAFGTTSQMGAFYLSTFQACSQWYVCKLYNLSGAPSWKLYYIVKYDPSTSAVTYSVVNRDTLVSLWNWSNYFNILASNDKSSFSFSNGWSIKLGEVVTCPDCPTCDDPYTSLECQVEYSLMPVESCNSEFCSLNNLCPVSSWGDYSWDLQFSNLYINDILHPWKQNIFVNIPDYITWDYTTTGDDFNIDVWSWYDMDYMNSIIKINSYRPDSWDFTNIFVSWLTLIFPYIFIALLIVFIWKLLKRIFK